MTREGEGGREERVGRCVCAGGWLVGWVADQRVGMSVPVADLAMACMTVE